MDINVLHRGQLSEWIPEMIDGWKTDTSIYLVKSWTQLLVHIHNIETGGVKLYPWYLYMYNRHTAILAPLFVSIWTKRLIINIPFGQ